MVKALLADRFKLRVRTEMREAPILELRLACSDGQVGSNLHDCSKEKVPETPFRAPTNGTVSVSDCADGGSSLADLASGRLKTIVVDKTGLKGRWWRKLPRQADSSQGDCSAVVGLGRNVRGGTRPRLSCGRSWL